VCVPRTAGSNPALSALLRYKPFEIDAYIAVKTEEIAKSLEGILKLVQVLRFPENEF
jgi:hypothetical protein